MNPSPETISSPAPRLGRDENAVDILAPASSFEPDAMSGWWTQTKGWRTFSSPAPYSLTPGSPITLLQKRPSYVVRVGETELALEAAIAREIFVKR